jgi:hypothetical protein
MMQGCSTMRRTFVLFLVEASWHTWFSIGIHILWGADGSNSTTALQPQRSQRVAINSSDFTSAAPSGDTSARPVRQAVARAGKCWTTAPAPLRSLPMAIYQRHSDGSIWRFVGPPCSGTSCPAWSHLDNNPSATSMAAGGFN